MEVIDINTDDHLGNIVDISMGGILLISRHPIEVNSVYQMKIRMPESCRPCDDIEFGGEVLWSEICNDSVQRWLGFQIIDISEGNHEQLSHLVERIH